MSRRLEETGRKKEAQGEARFAQRFFDSTFFFACSHIRCLVAYLCLFVSVSYFFLLVVTPVALEVHVYFFQTCSMYMF